MPCMETGEAGLKQNNFSCTDIEGASIQHPCQLLYTICPQPILNSSIRSCVLPEPLNLQELGSNTCNNSTGFNQQDSSDTLSTEIDELALNFPCICIILNFSYVEIFCCHLEDENLVN